MVCGLGKGVAALFIFALAGALVAAEPLHSNEATAQAAASGVLELAFNRDALRRLGVRVEGARQGARVVPLLLGRSPLTVALEDGAPTAVVDGELGLSGLRFRRADGSASPALWMRAAGNGLDLSLQDAAGREWLRISQVMRSPDLRADGLRYFTADVRVETALAAFAGSGTPGSLLANATLRVPLRLLAHAPVPARLSKTCAVPVWPGAPGSITDVVLTGMGQIDFLRCRIGSTPGCDGPGGEEGEVVFAPSATLQNGVAENAADVPWYTKFSGAFPPYDNDQHPFLVWNLYRIDAAGTLVQIARSGLKHAFATANTGCMDSTCAQNGHILGRGCSDIYNAGSNDCATFLGPRSDLIPALGLWGRCGSIHDPDCDGVQSPPVSGSFCAAPITSPAATDDYSFRLVVRESDLQVPDAAYLFDAWYIVRDDENIFNTMGYRSLAPTFSNGSWQVGALGPFRVGAVIDHWLSSTVAGAERRRAEIASGEGRVVVAVRVTREPDQNYRYDYAVMNFDFARAVTEGNGSQLQVIRNLGLSGVSIALLNGANVDTATFRDGDTQAGNDWLAQTWAERIEWTAPSGATLDWGRLVSFSIVSAAAPGEGALQLAVAEPGDPAFYSLPIIVPDAAQVFRDDFE